MGVSFSTITPGNMELSPMRVSFKGPTDVSFVDLGGTLGNVLVKAAYKKSNINADQVGKTVIDKKVSAVDISVTTEIAEIQNKSLWKVVFPHLTLTSGSGSFAGSKAVDFFNAIGDASVSNAGQLLLHPLSKPDTDLSTDYLFYIACSNADSEVTYSPDGQAKLKIVWDIFPDFTTTPARFFRYGDRNLT